MYGRSARMGSNQAVMVLNGHRLTVYMGFFQLDGRRD